MLKRFAWKKNHLVTMRHPEDNQDLDRKIMRIVTQELAAKGIVEEIANTSKIPNIVPFHATVADAIAGFSNAS